MSFEIVGWRMGEIVGFDVSLICKVGEKDGGEMNAVGSKLE